MKGKNQLRNTNLTDKKKINIPGITAILFFLMSVISFSATLYAAGLDSEFIYSAADSSEIYTTVDQMPEIIGGLPALYKEIRYPREAIRSGIEGRVFVQFVVDENGRAIDAEILRDIGGGCGDAAISAIEKVKFNPGLRNGVPVKVRFSLPVTFRIE